jgi:uncharacterized protein YjbJ (UPF0337 family)
LFAEREIFGTLVYVKPKGILGPPVGISNLKEGNNMTPSAKNEVAGNVHEVKGEVKEKVGQVTNKPVLEAEAKPKRLAGNSKRKSVRWGKPSENRADGSVFCGSQFQIS